MRHGGDIYQSKNEIKYDFSVSLNPFSLKERLINAGIQGLKDSGHYPDLYQRRIRKAIAEMEDISEDCVLAGNGASELLSGVVRYLKPKSAILLQPCYSGYEYALKSEPDCKIKHFSLSDILNAELNNDLNIESNKNFNNIISKEVSYIPSFDDIEAIFSEKPELLFLTDPWNPSGKNIPEELLKSIFERTQKENTWIILDESFLLLSDKALNTQQRQKGELIRQFPNVIVLTSYTKFLALPGVRMGYMLADKKVTEGIRAELPEWNLSIPAEYIMEEGIRLARDENYLREIILKIREERQYLTRGLESLGFRVFASDTCYIYFMDTESENPRHIISQQPEVDEPAGNNMVGNNLSEDNLIENSLVENSIEENNLEENILIENDFVENNLVERLQKEGILIRSYDEDEYPGKGYYRVAVKDHSANEYLIQKLQKIYG